MSKIERELIFYEACLDHYKTRVKELKIEIGKRKTRGQSTGTGLGSQDEPKKLAEEYRHFDNSRPGMVRISRPFGHDLEQMRILSLRLHTELVDELVEVFAFDADQVQLVRRSTGGNVEVKASVYDDHEGIKSLTLQRWDNRGKSPVKEAITLQQTDLTRFMIFLVSAFYSEFENDSGVKVMIDKLKENLDDMAKEYAESRRGRLEALMWRIQEEDYP